MLQSQVVIGGEYTIRMENKNVRVKVISDRGIRSGYNIKYKVQRVDSGRILPRFRTARSLTPIEEKQ